MVTVVNKPLSGHAKNMKALGRGASAIADTMQPLIQKRYDQDLKRDQMKWERDLLKTSLDEAQVVFNNPNSTPTQKMFAYEKAMAGNPGRGDRANAASFNRLFDMSQLPGGASENADAFGSGGGQRMPGQGGDPLTDALQQQNQERATMGNQAADMIFSQKRNKGGMTQAPYLTGMGPGQMQNPEMGGMGGSQQQMSDPKTLEDAIYQGGGFQGEGLNEPVTRSQFENKLFPASYISKVDNEERQKGIVDSPKVKELMNHNNRVREQDNQIAEMAANQKTISKANLGAQEDWQKFAASQAAARSMDLASPENAQIFNEVATSPAISQIDNFDKRFNATADVFNKLKGLDDSMVEMNQRDGWNKHNYDNSVKAIKQSIKPFLDMGLYGVVEKKLTKMGYGQLEIAEMTNDLNPTAKKTLSEGPTFKELNDDEKLFEANRDFMAPSQIEKMSLAVLEKRASLNKEWRGKIKDVLRDRPRELTKGLSLTPGPNLLLMREQYLAKGGKIKDFLEIVDGLEKAKEVSLDTTQLRDVNYLSKSPREMLGVKQIILNSMPGYVPKR